MHVNRSNLPVAITIILGIGLSTLAAIAITHQERTNQRLQFQRQTDTLTTSLQRSINRYTDILRSLGDFYTVLEQPVSRTDFNRFVERALATYPGIQALEWAPVVLADASTRADTTLPTRSPFEAAVKAEGYPNFQITEQESRGRLVRAGDRPYYVPVTYLQPISGNERALGYDLTSDSIRRTALQTARDTGSVAASGRIRLVQENKNQFGFLVFLPLYESQAVPDSAQAKKAQLQGYLLGVFRVAEVVEESLENSSYDIDFTIIDRSAPKDEALLGFYQASSQTVTTSPPPSKNSIVKRKQQILCPAENSCLHPLAVGGRDWAIAFTPTQNYPATTPWRAFSTFAIGLLLTLLVARYFAQAQSELIKTQELSALKIRLFSMASHELRTPLSTILLSAQTLEASLNNPDKRASTPVNRVQIYRRIRVAAKRMNNLLSDLLTLARAESGKLKFSPETFNIRTFCQQIVEEALFRFDNTPKITLTVSPSVPKAVYLDPQLLQSALSNLLSNAVKYSGEQPQVLLEVSYQAHQLIFRVSDRGIGISKSDRDRINEAFYRGKNVGDIAGTGLGLSVVSACLVLHRGSLACKSELGEGTTFTVTLPQAE